LIVVFNKQVKLRRGAAGRANGCYRPAVSVVTAPPTEPAEPADRPGAAVTTQAAPRRWPWHVFVAVLALSLSGWLTHGLWQDPATHAIANNSGDQAFFEWLLGYGVYTLGHGADPYFTDLLNAPLGVNLAVNTSITVYTVLLAPITWAFGPSISFLSILTLNLAGAAFAWYAFLGRYVVKHRAAAALAGMFCGFAPGFVSHANGHLNWSAGWIAPVLLWWVLKLREPDHRLRNGLVLGLLVTVGFSIAAEGLFFTALACGVFLLTWSLAPSTRAEARAALPAVATALAVTAVVAGALLAYPLWMHFAGPQTFSGTGFNQRNFAEDIAAYPSFPRRSLAGELGLDSNLAPNATEETSFFGLPLLVFVVTALVMLWRRASPGRRATLRALAVTGGVFTLLSLGPRLKIFTSISDVPMPYALVGHLPLFDSALPARLALVVVGVIGIVLAFAADRLLTAPLRSRRARTAWAAGFAAALVPIIPTPLLWHERAPIPRFITAGTWKQYVPDGGALTALPIAANVNPDGQRWQAYALAHGGPHFVIPGGYFLGPGGYDGKGRIGAPPRPTDRIFLSAARVGVAPPIDWLDREQARIDFAYWGVSAVILPDRISEDAWPVAYDVVKQTAINLLGPPTRVDDVWLWRITPGTDPVGE
jgi:hypothetical protein